MKRLVIIGNGFDLAHGLKTTYTDFLTHYWSKITNQFEDDLISFSCRDTNINCNSYPEFKKRLERINEEWLGGARIDFKFKNSFFDLLNNMSAKESKWVDIEMFYYTLLKQYFEKNKTSQILKLNNEFHDVKTEFEKYIEYVINSKKSLDAHYFDKMGEIFEPLNEINGKYNVLENKLSHNAQNTLYKTSGIPREISEMHVLNFNYTDTVKVYSSHLEKNVSFLINHIHGEAGNSENQIVFGFGDERDIIYAQLENANENEYLRFMKSSAYLKTRNYYDLLRFIESGAYIVEILGHSCGLSDRTLLKAIFEHENCTYIQIYYHQLNEKDNFNDLDLNISRHFDDKILLRKKVANKTFSIPLPQK